MTLKHNIALSALALVLASCAQGTPASAPAATTTSGPPSAAALPTSSGVSVYGSCKSFDLAFEILFGDSAIAATHELKGSYAKPGPALNKLRALIEQYAAELDKAEDAAGDAAMAKALAVEAEYGRLTVRLLDPAGPGTGEQFHVLWTRYFLNAGKDVAKLCPDEFIRTYRSVDPIRAEMR
jgi:hypothetical protein